MLLFTMGFDEKFVLRSILRNGLQAGETILLVLPEPADEPRVEKAINTLRTFVRQTQQDAKIETIKINLDEIYGSISKLATLLRETRGRIIANLSGGMRMIILATLAAILSSDVEATIEVEAESSKGYIKFPLELFRPLVLETVDMIIMRELNKLHRGSLDEVSQRLGMNKSSVWRRMKKLEELKLVLSSKDGKRIYYELTDAGKARLKMS